jgi:hypothetical protein
MARGTAGPAPAVPSRPLETIAADMDPGAMSEPGVLTINAEESGRVFVDGTFLADSTPVDDATLPAGRHAVQMLTNEGRFLAPPRNVVLRNGSNVAVFVRNAGLSGTVVVEDLRTTMTDGSGTPEPIQTPADNLGPAGETEGSIAPDPLIAAEPSEGSTAPGTMDTTILRVNLVDREAEPPVTTFRIHVVSEPDGVVFLDGVNTGVRTPTILDLDARPATLQVLQDDGNLSRHFLVNGAAGQGREVFFDGVETFLYR